MIYQVSQTMLNPESSQEPFAAVLPQVQLGLPVPKSPLLCPCRFFILFSFASLLLASGGSSLGSTHIPYSGCLSSHSANKQLPSWCWDSDSGFHLCLLSCRSCHHLSLSCLSCRRCQSRPHPLDLKCSLHQPSCLRTDLGGL